MSPLKRKMRPEAPEPKSHGGRRSGAGRPSGMGPWGEGTEAMRIPRSLKKSVRKFLEKDGYRLPVYSSRVPAGTPHPPAEGVEKVDLNSFLMTDPDDSFLLQVSGDSMIKAGIDDGDWLVVSRRKEVINGKIVVAMIDGQVTVKRFKKEKSGTIVLEPENDAYKPIRIFEGQALDISGVVSTVIKKL